MIINHNMNALNAHRMMTGNTATAGKSMEKLSSGLRINRAGDDAAGLAISEKMRGQIRGLDQAARNGQDGISMIQTAEGALNETHSILQRMRELAVQSSNDTNVAVDRTEIQKEMDELAKEVTRISNNTEFNTQKLINGGIKDDGIKSAKFHVGANANQDITLSINAMDAKSLGVSRDLTSATVSAATDVTAATISGTTGSAIVDGASIDVSTALVSETAASATVKAGSAASDTLTINTVATGAATNDFQINLTTATDDTLAVSVTGNVINIALANTTAGNNTAANIQTAIRGLGTVNGIDLSGATATAAGSWDSAATATGETGVVDFAGGNDDSYTVTFNDGSTTVDVTGLAGTETSIAGTGAYAGLTLTTDGAFDENLASTVTISSEAATAATFVSGEKTADAVTEAGLDVSTQSAASSAITTIQTAIETVSAERSKLGAYQNRLEHTIANLGTASENLTSAESRVRDVDMAKEMMAFSKNNILSQAAQAMLAQANQQPQGVLQLLR